MRRAQGIPVSQTFVSFSIYFITCLESLPVTIPSHLSRRTMAYGNMCSFAERRLNDRFLSLSRRPMSSSQMKHGDHHSHAQFFEAYSAKLNVSVIAIRGTDVGRISDLIEDIKVSHPDAEYIVMMMLRGSPASRNEQRCLLQDVKPTQWERHVFRLV